jgi:hypothetical protein
MIIVWYALLMLSETLMAMCVKNARGVNIISVLQIDVLEVM